MDKFIKKTNNIPNDRDSDKIPYINAESLHKIKFKEDTKFFQQNLSELDSFNEKLNKLKVEASSNNFENNDGFESVISINFFEIMKNLLLNCDIEEKFKIVFISVNKIVNLLISLTEALLVHQNDSNNKKLNTLTEFLENLYFFFIFYHHIRINFIGISILIFLLRIHDFDFHVEMFEKLITINKMIMDNRKINLVLGNKFISSISFSLNAVIQFGNIDVVNRFYKFLMSSEEYILPYFICSFTNEENNFSQLFNYDDSIKLLEKFCKEFEKIVNSLESLFTEVKKNPKNIQISQKFRNSFNNLNLIIKILDSILIKSNKSTYTMSKKITLLREKIQSIFDNLLIIQDINEIDFSMDSLLNIIVFYENLEGLNFEKKVIILSVICRLCDKGLPKYLILLYYSYIITIRNNKLSDAQESIIDDLTKGVVKVIQNHLEIRRQSKENYDNIILCYIKVIIDEINTKTNYLLKNEDIFEEFVLEFAQIDINHENNYIFLEQVKEFSTISNENLDKIEKRTKINIALLKLREYKNSMKDVFNILNQDLCVDNKIDNYIDSMKSEHIDDIELFEASIQMHKEIFQKLK